MGSAKDVVRQESEAKTVTLGPNQVTFVLKGSDTGGSYSLTAFDVAPPPAPGPPLHVHQDADEALYVVEGRLEVRLGEQATTLAPGGVALVPKGTRHTLANPGPGASRILIVLSPPGFEGFWEESATLLAASDGAPAAAQMLALQRKYHLETGGQVRQFTGGPPR